MFAPIALEETLNRVIDELCYLEIKHDRIRLANFISIIFALLYFIIISGLSAHKLSCTGNI